MVFRNTINISKYYYAIFFMKL